MDRLTANITHEMMTPLKCVVLYCEFLLKSLTTES